MIWPSLWEAAWLVGGGCVAGFINTLAGGGSFLTVPLLIGVLGIPGTVANATNRVGVAAQSVAAMAGFRQESVPGTDTALRLLPAMLLGSWAGAWLASSIPDVWFERGFGLVMLAMLPVLLRNPSARGPARTFPLLVQLGVYFAIGFYGGAVQAGIGIPLLLGLVAVGGLDLVRANSVKVVLVAALTLVALAQFAFADKILWGYGLVLAVGSAAGGYAASRFGARVGPRLIRPILTLAIIVAAARLLIWPFFVST